MQANNRSRHRWTGIGCLLVLSVIGMLALAAWPTVSCVIEQQQYYHEVRQIEIVLKQWDVQQPHDPNWSRAVGWLRTALANVCFSPEHVSMAEIRALRAEVTARDVGPADKERLEWLWHRFEATGPHGQKYIQQWQPEWDAAWQTPIERRPE